MIVSPPVWDKVNDFFFFLNYQNLLLKIPLRNICAPYWCTLLTTTDSVYIRHFYYLCIYLIGKSCLKCTSDFKSFDKFLKYNLTGQLFWKVNIVVKITFLNINATSKNTFKMYISMNKII